MSLRSFRFAPAVLPGLIGLLLPAPARADKLPADFRAMLEQTFRTNHTFAVVMQEGVPTTSIYGINGNQSAAHYSVDIVDGRWKTSEGLLDTDQRAADALSKGEVMELASLSWKDNRVDMRLVSVEAHKVTRGSWPLKTTKREPVATNFKFFFPFRASGISDVPRAVEYISRFVRPFPSEAAARSYSGRLASGDDRPAAESVGLKATAGPLTTDSTAKNEIKTGMTPLEVIDVLGKPQKEITFENKARWTYPDLTVLFENGRVKEVKF